ncbi:hypothetical protein [Bosea minatitlanensis]|uniref:DdrB-like domain-containing protein n=1 Tax=Bosea minatitlanensis TaxID=128782 RepID=A0ABW0EWJ1_9HYPH|nr:hypothetical protein [Bosea minatitlanensis]MCT4495402.1 hypothetical protein [Bosea minatitlanensis]
MSWDSAFAGEREQAARGPVPAAPATLGEIWRSGWDAAGLDTVFGQGDPWNQAQGELRQAVEGAAGMSAAELAKAQGRSLRAVDWAGATWQDQARELGELSAGLTPEQQEKVKPFLDVPARARRISADRERQAADIADRTYGLTGHAVGFLAGVSRAAIDPINLGTMFLGGPLASSVPKMLAREAALGAGIQAVQEPFVQAGRAELGLEAGIGRALGNVLEAGIGNAGLAGLFRGAGWLMSRAARAGDAPAVRAADAVSQALQEPRLDAGMPAARSELVANANALHAGEAVTPAAAEPAIPASLRDLGPADLDAAARLAERDELIDHLAPDQSGAGKLVHAETVETMIARMEESRQDIMAGLDSKIAELETRLRQSSGDAQAQTAGGEGVSPPAPPARRRRPPAERKPVSLARFIAENGGLKIDDQGEVRYLGINQMFVPGAGMVGRIDGKLLDRDLEPLLIAEGYLRPQDPNMPSRDVTQEVHDALVAEFTHKRPLYRFQDQARVEQLETGRTLDMDQRWRDEIAAEADGIRQQLTEAGHRVEDWDPQDISDAADRLVRGVDESWETALERVVMARELAHDASPTALAAAEDLPDWEIADAIFGRDAQPDSGRAGSQGRADAGAGGESRSGAAGDQVPGAGQDGPGQGGPAGDQALAGSLARLAQASDDPALFKARLADLQRNLEAAGGDIRLELDTGPVSARKLLEEIRDDATAADALKACLGQGVREGGS